MSNFIFQTNQYGGALLPCTLADFNQIVDSQDVSWRISMRQSVENAIKDGKSVDEFLKDRLFQQFCSKHSSEEAFQKLTPADKLRRWTNDLKTGLTCFIFAAKAFKGSKRRQEDVVLGPLFMFDADHLACDPREVFARTQVEGFPWQIALGHNTSSGMGLRLVAMARPELGNIADNQICLARDLGILDMMGTTGNPVVDRSCIDASRISYAPRREDILYIDEELLFGNDDEDKDVDSPMERLYGEAYRKGSSDPIHAENRFHEDTPAVSLVAGAKEVSPQPQGDGDFPLVFGHQPVEYVKAMYPNGVTVNSRHKTTLSLANSLIILRDGSVDAVRHDLLQLGFVQEIIKERGQTEVENIIKSAKALMEKRESTYYTPPKPSAFMQRAIQKVTGRSYSSLVAEQQRQMMGGQASSPDEDMRKFLLRLAEKIKKQMPRYPLMELVCKGRELKHYVAAMFIGGAFGMNLMTRCWYSLYGSKKKQNRLNCILEIIGRMGGGKQMLVDLYRIMTIPIKEADKKQEDALNKWNKEHEQKNGSAKNSTVRPTGIYRSLPSESTAAAIREAMFNNVEEIDGEKVRLHVSIVDSELDISLTNMRKEYMNIASLHLKAFHNEPQGAFQKNTSTSVGEVDVAANFMYSGTEYALKKQITAENYGSGLVTRLTVVPTGETGYEMMPNQQITAEDEQRNRMLTLWSEKLDRTRGELPIKPINDALYNWTKQRMEEARENQSKTEEDLLKRVCWHAVNFSLPFIVTRHWDQMRQDEHGYWLCDDCFKVDKYDIQLALMIADAQLSFQHYYFKAIGEKYYAKLYGIQNEAVTMQSHTQLAYSNLPDIFTREDIDRCYGYEGNRNSINSCIKRLHDNGKAQRIRAGEHKGKYRKIS